MKRVYEYILLSALMLIAVGCVNENFNHDGPSAVSGDDVKFSLSLQNPETKTVYGTETGGAFPIYWVEGDKVQIFSPECISGRRSAEYKVVLPSGVENPNYATDLICTGETGVQWGEANEANFYSLYPSGEYTLSSDGSKAENVTIRYMQNIVVSDTGVKSDMEDCLMYAKSEGVDKGETVYLTYSPISTVVYVTIKAPNVVKPITIQSVSLTANEDIAGTFSLNVADGTFYEFEKDSASDVVSAQISSSSTGGFHSIAGNQTLSVPLFLAPKSDLKVEGWQIKVVANNRIYTKNLNLGVTLTPGMIHKITLPELTSDAEDWVVESWMENIPRNVYLSEVSIPGSWNTVNSAYQSKTSISEQYSIGTRAFHLDTRWRTTDKQVSIVGNLSGNIDALSVAGGAESGKYNGGDRVVSGNAKTFAEYLKDITDNIIVDPTQEELTTKPEYMVLMCTFAQDSYDYKDNEGNNWVSAISAACASNDFVYDAKLLTSNTLIGDVLGKVIVIVNMEGDFTTVPQNSKCLFVNLPLTLKKDYFDVELTSYNSGNIYKGKSNSVEVGDTGIDMYHTHAQISIAGDTYEGNQSRDNVMGRGFAPTYGERRTVANNILSWSRTNYGTENYAHDKWIYLGLGGYYSHYDNGTFGIGAGWKETQGSNATVASLFNSWIDGKVEEMGADAVPYYPVGIILMNDVNTYSETVEKILLLNNKYRLQYDKDKPVDYNPGTGN